MVVQDFIFLFQLASSKKEKWKKTKASSCTFSYITGAFYALLQVECIMSILIYKNLVKGYFAHKSKVVVLSKQDPFPRLTGKAVNS